MTRRRKRQGDRGDQATDGQGPPEPVNVVDGIPDRSERTPAWRYVVLAAVFLCWLAFLIYCAAGGGV